MTKIKLLIALLKKKTSHLKKKVILAYELKKSRRLLYNVRKVIVLSRKKKKRFTNVARRFTLKIEVLFKKCNAFFTKPQNYTALCALLLIITLTFGDNQFCIANLLSLSDLLFHNLELVFQNKILKFSFKVFVALSCLFNLYSTGYGTLSPLLLRSLIYIGPVFVTRLFLNATTLDFVFIFLSGIYLKFLLRAILIAVIKLIKTSCLVVFQITFFIIKRLILYTLYIVWYSEAYTKICRMHVLWFFF